MRFANTAASTASRLLAAACLSVLFGTSSFAATAPATKPAHHATPSEIDALFSALGKAENEEEAKPIEDKILAAFLNSGSPTVDLLMNRAAAALQAGDGATAKKLIASVTDIAPDYAEAWHQRGVMQADAGDDQGAMFCLQKAVALNPRQFAALAELASELDEYGDKPGALRLYRRALALDPHYDDLPRKVRELEHAVEGESL